MRCETTVNASKRKQDNHMTGFNEARWHPDKAAAAGREGTLSFQSTIRALATDALKRARISEVEGCSFAARQAMY